MQAAARNPTIELETRLLLEAIYERYQHDFRDYAAPSLRRRILLAMQRLGCRSISGLQEKVLHEPSTFDLLMNHLTVQVSEMFRDPGYYRALREHVLPVLATWPSPKIWVAGCSTGEEAYSLAILLEEEGLLDRCILYATDINEEALRRARDGMFPLDRARQFTENHRKAGGRGSLSDHYRAAHDAMVMDARLRRRITFAEHSLATDAAFSEVHFVSCRNVLIYFRSPLQDRALGLFHESLCRNGFLGVGSRETPRFSAWADRFAEVDRSHRLYRRVG